MIRHLCPSRGMVANDIDFSVAVRKKFFKQRPTNPREQFIVLLLMKLNDRKTGQANMGSILVKPSSGDR